MTPKSSVERVRAALLAAGHPDTVSEFPAGTRTAADAAVAVQGRSEEAGPPSPILANIRRGPARRTLRHALS